MNGGCYLCGSEAYAKREGSVRDNKTLEVRECLDCGLVYLSDFSHIDKSFYEDSKMHSGAVEFDAWRKETYSDDKRRYEFLSSIIAHKDIVDFGSGNGGFLELAKQSAKSVCGIEVEKKVHAYYDAREICCVEEIDQLENDSVDIITAFHVIEHLPDPIATIKQLSKKLKENGKIIIEVPNADDALLTMYGNEAFQNFSYWSCHLMLFTRSTLHNLMKKSGLSCEAIKYIQRYPLSNHLYWLAKGSAGGHQVWGDFIDSDALSHAYEAQLASLGKSDTLIGIFSK